MQIGYIQFAPEFGETAKNLETLEEIAREHAKGADLLVLPELAGTGYLFTSREETLRYAEPYPEGPTVSCFARIARETGAAIVGGFAERRGDRAFNSAAFVRPDGSGTVYRKAQLFMEEKSFFEPGDTPFEPVEYKGVKLGLMICFDWYYPEVARLLALRGAHILCHPSNLVLPYCPESMKTRCLENRVFAVTTNRTGSDRRGDRELRFIGMSQITGPDGSIILRAPRDGVHVGIAEIDPSLAENKDLTGNNVWTEDRRKDLFGGLAE